MENQITEKCKIWKIGLLKIWKIRSWYFLKIKDFVFLEICGKFQRLFSGKFGYVVF